jgi:hypothetical protein
MKRILVAFMFLPAFSVVMGCASTEVKIDISGTGRVTSNPEGIDCTQTGGDKCSADLGRAYVLTAVPAPGIAFGGWSGDERCLHEPTATLVVNNEDNEGLHCTANFTAGPTGMPQ